MSGRRPWGSLYPLLDLHGLTADEAARRAEAWLRDRRERGERTVVVVTGRGNRSAGPPVLRTELQHLLERLRGELVAGWEPEPGGGAFRVQLSPSRPRPAPVADQRAARRVAAADPALRTRAEESLWELGITPTPALLDAEIRRLLRASGEPAGED